MDPLALFTDLELLEELQRRQEEKELAYLVYLGISDADEGNAWLYMSDLTYDDLQDIYEDEMDTFSDNLLYDSDNWTSEKDDEDEEDEEYA